MTLYEEIQKIKPIPEIQEAVEHLVNDNRKGSALSVFYDTWYEINGERVELCLEEVSESELASDTQECEEDYDNDLIERISGMPLILLFYYPRKNPSLWDICLSLDIPKYCEVSDAPSLYSLFLQSRYHSLFHKYGGDLEDETVCADLWLQKDINTAAKLISYYIRYYGCDQEVHKYKFQMCGSK